MYISLNDLYDEMEAAGLNCEGRIGVPHSGNGALLGFLDAADVVKNVRVSFDGWGASDNGCPVMAITYPVKSLPWNGSNYD